MGQHREQAVRDHELQFNFRNMGSNPSAFTDLYAEAFDAHRGEIEAALAETAGTLTGNKLTLIRATYDIPVAEYDDFFAAYTAALQDAFVDFVVENPRLVTELEAAYEDAVDAFR